MNIDYNQLYKFMLQTNYIYIYVINICYKLCILLH